MGSMSTDLRTAPQPADTVGRALDLIGVQGRLQDPSNRLITLTGPGGVGKSRLASDAVRSAAGEFPGGIRFVDLPAAASDEAAVRDAGAPWETVPDGRALLFLDGVDHLARRLAPVVAEQLAELPWLTVLATGQQGLRIYGERVLPVDPLPPPGLLPEPGIADVQDNPAVRLFVRRAYEVNPEFALTAENVEEVVDICNLLEGVPLLLELAARRLRLFPLRELRGWLHRGGDSHFSGPVDVPARQRSVLAIAAWSCRSLDEGRRALLAGLAVFAGGATLATAEKVSPLAAGETAEAIEELLDRNLLTIREQPRADSRLVMSRTIRAYGLALLEESGQTTAARDAHARHYRELLHTVEGRFQGSEQRRWLQVAGNEHANVMVALDHLRVTGAVVERAALVAACLRPWLVRGELREGLRRFDEALEALPGDESEPGLRLRARLCAGAGVLAAALGDHDRASHLHRRSIALYKRLKDGRRGARASARMGLALFRCGDRAVGQSLLTAAHTRLEAQGDTTGSAEAAAGLAEALDAAGRTEEARELLDRSVRLQRQNGEIRDLAHSLLVGARLSLRAGDETAAHTALRESLTLFDSIDERTELPAALEMFALLIQHGAGQPRRATRLLAAADALRRTTGERLTEERAGRLDEAAAGLRKQLGWTVFGAAWLEGLRLPAEAMAGEALAAVEPGRAEERSEAAVLTPRQLQVALLVAEGMTNRQVAHQLGIAEWTVVNHVRHVMRKLRCGSRVQVAWAVGRRQ